MFIVECYIFIGATRATASAESQKDHYMQLFSNLIVLLLLIVFFIS